MNFKEYQEKARGTAIYPTKFKIIYPTLGLTGEAGEVAEKIKKWIRDGSLDKEQVEKELGDVLWYWANLCSDLKISTESVAIKNIKKLQDRKERNVLHGSGDNR
jgi:NTP pyrophosphatase (non-canonical NTP hydrolase)